MGIILPLLMLLTLTVGCTIENKETPTSAVESEWNLGLNSSLGHSFTVPTGSDLTIPITAFVTKDGVAAAGVSVSFSTYDANGYYDANSVAVTLDPPIATTDANGIARSNLEIIGSRGEFQLSLHADVEDKASDYAYFDLTCTGTPDQILISAPTNDLLVLPDQSGEMTFSVLVVDSGGAVLSSVPIKFYLAPTDSNSATFGTLSGPQYSGYDRQGGKTSIVFDSRGGLGRQKIVVQTDYLHWSHTPIRSELVFGVRQINELAGAIKLNLSPNHLVASPDGLVSAEAVAQVTTLDHRPMPGIFVKFTTDFGALTPSNVTDGLGVAKATFTNNFASGVAHITAYFPGTNISDSDSIVVAPGLTDPGTITLTSNKEFIYADNGRTTAKLRAVLKDAAGDPLADASINFSCPMGAVTSPVTTNEFGVAEAIFTDLGLPSHDENGNLIPVPIRASFAPWGISASVGVEIREVEPIAAVTLTADRLQVEAGSGDTIRVRATAFLRDGSFAPVGTLIDFWTNTGLGSFGMATAPVTGFGVAENVFVPGAFPGLEVIHAQADGFGESTSNEVEITILRGPPTGVSMSIEPTVLDGDDPTATAIVEVTVTSGFGRNTYPVIAGTLVNFAASAGEIEVAATTDSNGVAAVRYRPDGAAGEVTITATVESRLGVVTGTGTLIVTSGRPDTIELNISPEQLGMPQSGEETATARAIIRDANGNRVERPTTVVFQLLNQPDAPLGCNINNHGRIDSTVTRNGEAVVSVNSGEQIGGVIVRAYTWRDPDSSNTGWDDIPRNDTVSVINSRLAVIGGPPFQCDISVDSRGEDAGGGTWELEVAVHVWDVHRNPIADGLPVMLTVDPQVATIENAVTGNRNRDGVSTPGVAYSKLRYHSQNTFVPITISAEVQAPDGIMSWELVLTLPLQRGRVTLAADPGNWMFDRQRPNDTCAVRVWATVRDGHDITINNAPVIFSADRSRFYWRNLALNGRYVMFFPNPARKYTGLVDQSNNEERGVATVYLRGVMNEFFLDDFTLEVTVRLQAQVEGYDDAIAEPVSLSVNRH